MKDSEVIELIKGRDKLIERLILSHLQTLGKDLDIYSQQGIEMCKRLLVNPFALDEIVDYKRTNEIHAVMQDESVGPGDKIAEFLDEERGKKLASMLKDLASKEKIRLLKETEIKIYETKY